MSHNSIGNSNKNSPINGNYIVGCARCAGSADGSIKGTRRTSRYSRDEQTAPSVAPKVIFTPIPQRPLRDEIAAHGSYDPSKMSHLMGGNKKFTEEREKEVLERIPQNHQIGKEPTGPCAYEISQYLVCAGSRENLQDCEMIDEDLQKCKKKYKLP